jgi:hypothetical protein
MEGRHVGLDFYDLLIEALVFFIRPGRLVGGGTGGCSRRFFFNLPFGSVATSLESGTQLAHRTGVNPSVETNYVATLLPRHSARVRHRQESPCTLDGHPYSASRSSLPCPPYCTNRPATIS